MVTDQLELPMVWRMVKSLLEKGVTVTMRATHLGDATVGKLETGTINQVREDGYLLDGCFCALFPEDDEWKTLKKVDATNFCVVNR